jgi:hypothetical protein
MSATRTASPDPQGHLACDFLVPVGYAIQLRIGGVDTDNLVPTCAIG